MNLTDLAHSTTSLRGCLATIGHWREGAIKSRLHKEETNINSADVKQDPTPIFLSFMLLLVILQNSRLTTPSFTLQTKDLIELKKGDISQS